MRLYFIEMALSLTYYLLKPLNLKKMKIIEKGRNCNEISLFELTNKELSKTKGGALCVCDVRFCLDCECVEAGFCICDVKRNCD
jgi:hypothetical protein